jgi:uncharacterized protein (TIGR03032 family)
MIQSLTKTNPTTEPENLREVRYEHSNNFAAILNHLNISLFFSTYQAGKLGVLTAKNNSLAISFHNFEQAMGIAISPTQMAVGGKDWVYFLRNVPDLAPQIEPVNSHDGCFLTRGAQYTGDIAIHDLAWDHQELWFVNTRFSCLCTLTNTYNFLPQWRPTFVSAIAPEDRCHLNGLAMVNGMPKYVTVLGQTDTPGGWRDNKATHGCVLEVPSGKVITEGLSMPHSPRVHQNLLWVLNSGHGEIMAVDLATSQKEKVASLPGYTRGLALADRFAFIGLSKIRETAIFGNLPICDRFDELKCGIAIVDLQTQQMISLLEFTAGVDEIFDVQMLQGIKSPVISGPHAIKDGDSPIWLLPASSR